MQTMLRMVGFGDNAGSYSPEDYINKNLQSSIRDATTAKILYLNKAIEQFGSGFKTFRNEPSIYLK